MSLKKTINGILILILTINVIIGATNMSIWWSQVIISIVVIWILYYVGEFHTQTTQKLKISAKHNI